MEVVSVKMHWVSLGTEVGHRNTDGLLGDWELVDSPLLLEGHVAVKDVLVQVVVHVSTEAGAVDVPQEVSAVALESDIKVNAVDISISSVKRNSAESRRVGNRIIAASVPLSWREVRTSWWNSVLVGTLVVDGSDSLGGDTVGERAALARWGVTHGTTVFHPSSSAQSRQRRPSPTASALISSVLPGTTLTTALSMLAVLLAQSSFTAQRTSATMRI